MKLKKRISLVTFVYFISYQTKPVCSNAVTSLCAMGMLISDARISSAALKEMPKLTDSNYTMDIHLLTCLSMFLTVNYSDSNINLTSFLFNLE